MTRQYYRTIVHDTQLSCTAIALRTMVQQLITTADYSRKACLKTTTSSMEMSVSSK